MKLWHWMATFLLAGLLGVAALGCVETAPCPGGMWTPGHHNRHGHWISGHWRCPTQGWRPRHRRFCPAPTRRVWLRGYYNRWGRWVRGSWACR